MPINDLGEYIPSKADNTTDTLNIGMIGGVGQLIYHLFRFSDYELEYSDSGDLLARPVYAEGKKTLHFSKDSPTGQEVFISMYNLALRINDPEEKISYIDLILEWCRDVVHPYTIDFIAGAVSENGFDRNDLDYIMAHDGIFSISDFMRDLERFYQTASFYFALDQLKKGFDEGAYALSRDGRHFSGLANFEKYRYDPEDEPEIDYSSAEGDLLKMMQLDAEARKKATLYDWFIRNPLDDYPRLLRELIEFFPDFTTRMKINPRNNRVVMAADVHSVFDICWYVLARKISEDGSPRKMKKEREIEEGVMVNCPYCGRAFVRRNNRHIICGRDECKRALNRKNKKNSRENLKLTVLKSEYR